MGYDLDEEVWHSVLTHAKALVLHPEYDLIGAVDSRIQRVSSFEKIFSRPGFSIIENALGDLNPDMVVIATPTNSHAVIMEKVLSLCTPRAILCEKPLAYKVTVANAMVELCSLKGVDLLVNYPRRSDAAVQRVKSLVRDGDNLGAFEGVARYGKGLIHNGTHLLDMLTFWFGSSKVDHVMPQKKLLTGDIDGDIDFQLQFKSGRIEVESQGLQSDVFNLQIHSQAGILRYEAGGNDVTWQSLLSQPTPIMRDFRMKNSMNRYQYEVYTDLARRLRGQSTLLCSGAESLMSLSKANATLDIVRSK